MWNEEARTFLPFGVHAQLQADSSFDFAVVSKELCGPEQVVEGVSLQSICLLDTLLVCLLFRVRVSGNLNPSIGCIHLWATFIIGFCSFTVYVCACRCMVSSSPCVSSVLQCLEHTELFDFRLRELGHVWTPHHILKSSWGLKLYNTFYMVQRVPRAWSVIHAWEVIVSPWCFYCSNERQDCRVSSAYWLVSCWAEDLAYTTAIASSVFWSVTRRSLGVGMALGCRWPLVDQKSQPGHPWCCRGLFEPCVHHISENHCQHLLNLVSKFEYKKNWVTVKHCAIASLWLSFAVWKIKPNMLNKGLEAYLVYFVTYCDLKVKTVDSVAQLTDWFGIPVFP